MNEENLIPFSQRSESEARENGQKGGKASGEARRKKKALKDCMKLLLSLPVTDNDSFDALAMMGVPNEDADNRMLMTLGLFRAAAAGNVQAYREARELIGEGDDLDRKLKRAQIEKIKAETEAIRKRADSGGAVCENELPMLYHALEDETEGGNSDI